MRRALRELSSVLICSGVLLLVDAGVTLAWQEPLSALYARITQNALQHDLTKLENQRPNAAELQALAQLHTVKARIAFLARALSRAAKKGDAIGRISIPKIHARYVLVQGTDETSLQSGPGHYPDTPFPGLPGTVAIAGHRTTFLAPFRQIDKLRKGDEINLRMPYAIFTYQVQRTQIVLPTAYHYVTRRVGYDRLALSACHPLYSASHRIIAFARLVSTTPRGYAVLR